MSIGCVTPSRNAAPDVYDEDGIHRVAHPPGTCRACDLFFLAKRSVVQVRTSSSLGAGIVLSKDGLLATNAHVVQSDPVVLIETVEGQQVLGDVLTADVGRDLALARARDSTIGWSAISTHEGDRPRVGSTVFLIGHPLGLGWTVTRGMISGEREMEGSPAIQIDAGISPGNSGGPVLDEDGGLVGIVMSKAEGGGAESIAFARPVSALDSLLEGATNGAVGSKGQP